MVSTHYLYGALFENLVISEIIKYQNHLGKRPAVYYWRESNGIEIDCIVEKENNEILVIEIKGGQTFNKDYLKNLKKFPQGDQSIRKMVIYTGDQNTSISDTQIRNWSNFPEFLKATI